MKTIRKFLCKIASFSAALLLAISTPPALAVDWIQTDPGVYDWNNDANWNATFPNGGGTVADLTNAISGDQTIFLNQTIVNQNVRIGAATGNFVLTNGTLNFQGTPTLVQVAGSNTIAANVALSASLNVAGTAVPLTIAGNISGGQWITINGGKLVLSGTNSLGTIAASGATVEFVGRYASGSGQINNNDVQTPCAWRFLNDGAGDNGVISYVNSFGLTKGQGSSANATLYVGPQTTARGNTLVFSNNFGTSGDANIDLNVTGANGYSVEFTGVFTHGGANNGQLRPLVVNPTTASLIVNKLRYTGGGAGGSGQIYLSGSAVGNIVRGMITNENAAHTLYISKIGSSLWDLRGPTSAYVLIQAGGGTLRLSHADTIRGGLGLSGGLMNLYLNGGVVELTAASGDLLRGLGTGASQVQFTDHGGFSAYGTNCVVNLGGSTGALTWASTPSFIANAKTLLFGSVASDAQLDFQNPINLNGAVRTIQVTSDTNAVNGRTVLSGGLSGTGSSGLTKTGNGTLVLPVANGYSNTTTVSAGLLLVHSSLPGSVNVTGGGLGGTGVISGAVTLSTNCVLNPGDLNESGPLTLSSNLTIGAGARYYWDLGNSESYDTIAVAGTLTIPTNMTVYLTRPQGAFFPDPIVVFSFGQLSPAVPDLSGWKVVGLDGYFGVRGNQIVIQPPYGTRIIVF